MSGEFDDQLKARLQRELSRAYQADDNPAHARYQALAVLRAGIGGAGSLLSAAARLRLAALVVLAAVVVGGAAVVDASRSSQGLIIPLLQSASERHLMESRPSTEAPATTPIKVSDRSATTDPAGGHKGSAPATDRHSGQEQEAPALAVPAPSPEQASGAPEAGKDRESAPKPGCSPPPSNPGHPEPGDPGVAPHSADGQPAEHATPESGQPASRDHCG